MKTTCKSAIGLAAGLLHALTKASDTRQADSGWGCKRAEASRNVVQKWVYRRNSFGAFQNSSVGGEEVQRHFGSDLGLLG